MRAAFLRVAHLCVDITNHPSRTIDALPRTRIIIEHGPMPVRPPRRPYRVPAMAEIAAVPLNGYRVASTFSGCGGSSLGYRMAGFQVVWANEFIAAASDVYRANFPARRSISAASAVEPGEMLAATGLQVGELDLLDGSPPCASFSVGRQAAQGLGRDQELLRRPQATDRGSIFRVCAAGQSASRASWSPKTSRAWSRAPARATSSRCWPR